MLTKVFGWGFVILGVAVIVFCPWTGHHQPFMMTNAIILTGIVLLGIGLFLLRT